MAEEQTTSAPAPAAPATEAINDSRPALLTEPVAEDEEVEVDNQFNDSAFEDDGASETTSITSSIYRGYIENGRRYQNVREGEYWGPADEEQFEAMKALHLVHAILDSKQPNPLFHAPISEDMKHILDVGTGDGEWARDCADKFPQVHVTGFDLYPVLDNWQPPNCTFEVDDAAKKWTWKQKFDLIHMRWLMGSFTPGQWQGLYQQAYNNLAPGGWIEQVEPGVDMCCDDDTLPANSSLAEWGKLCHACGDNCGKSFKTLDEMKSNIEAAGFINVHEKTYKVPYGSWAKAQIHKDAGRVNMLQFEAGMEGYAMFLLTKFGPPEPWSVQQVQTFLAGVRNELDKGWHIYQVTKRVWAQKPFEEKAKAETKVEVENVGEDTAR